MVLDHGGRKPPGFQATCGPQGLVHTVWVCRVSGLSSGSLELGCKGVGLGIYRVWVQGGV